MARRSNDIPDPRVSLPHVVTDPVASLRPWPLDVRLGRLVLHIPAMVAADWLAVLMTKEFVIWDIIPGLCPDQEDEFVAFLTKEEFTFAEYRDVCLDVITTAAGRPWWFSIRLIHVAVSSWEVVGGRLAVTNIDATRISLGAWLDATLITCIEGMKPEQVPLFMAQLEAPPPDMGIEVKEPEMSVSSFMALGR